MDPHSFVYSAVLLLVVAALAVALFRHLGLGSILGLLVTGVIVGPHTPGPYVTTEVDGVRQFAEIGVVMLLFLIGLEIKPSRLWSLRRQVFGLGSLQIICTAVPLACYFHWIQWSWPVALLLGASFALSSTAVVMQLLRDQGEIASAHGQTAFAILLMQDLAVVPLLAMVPLVAGNGALHASGPLWKNFGFGMAMILLVCVAGRYVVPRILDYLARRNHREAFFLTTLVAVFGAALTMDRAGMSMALGAFLMGMMLSTSRYSLQIEATLEPHKGLLMSLFFVAVGMSVDVAAIGKNLSMVTAHVLVILCVKTSVLFVLCLAFGRKYSSALRVSFLLSQGGEFGFVVFGAALALGAIDDQTFVIAIAVISITMLLTPLLAKTGNWLAMRLRPEASHPAHHSNFEIPNHQESVRAVVVGYGRVGHTVGTILGNSGIAYVAFESNAKLADRWQKEGHPVYFGDICNPALLASVALQSIELVVLTIDDGPTALRAAALIRANAPQVTIVARARDLVTCDALHRAGVNCALPETLEASLRLAKESLEALGLSSGDSESVLRDMRLSDYEQVRSGPEGLARS